MSQQNLCFFSTRCRFSQNFLEELSRTPFSKEFRFICVDPRPDGTRPQLPSYLKAVPTLMIQGEKAPRTDNEVINWIAERRLRGGSGSGSGSGNGGSGGSGSGGGGLGGGSLEGIGGFDGPVAFGGEMFSSGDEQFAYIGDDTSTSQSAMVRLAGNMASLDNIDAMVAPDARARGAGPGSSSSGGGGKAQSAKGKALDDAFASYQAARDRDMPGGQRRI